MKGSGGMRRTEERVAEEEAAFRKSIYEAPTMEDAEARAIIKSYRTRKSKKSLKRLSQLIMAFARMVPPRARAAAHQTHGPAPKASTLAGQNWREKLSDIQSAGFLGLYDAVELFDESRDAKFQTAAHYSINKRCWEEARQQCANAGIVAPRRHKSLIAYSLDAPAYRDSESGEQEGSSWHDRVGAADAPRPEPHQSFDLEGEIDRLPSREAQILRARYLTENPKRLRELSEELGITTGRVHQLEQQAISRLRDGTVVLTEAGIEEAKHLLAEKWGRRKVA